MKNSILNLPTNKAAMVVGVAFITSLIIVTLVDDLLLPNFVVPGDTEKLASDIEANRGLFRFAVVGYLLVLVLDAIIGLALYVVLKPANKNLALLTSVLRLLYAFTLVIGLFALAFQISDAYGYASIKLVGYLFFLLHLLTLGYSVLKSGYVPKSLGVLLMLASLTYSIFFVDLDLPGSLMVMIMLIMAIAELSLSRLNRVCLQYPDKRPMQHRHCLQTHHWYDRQRSLDRCRPSSRHLRRVSYPL